MFTQDFQDLEPVHRIVCLLSTSKIPTKNMSHLINVAHVKRPREDLRNNIEVVEVVVVAISLLLLGALNLYAMRSPDSG